MGTRNLTVVLKNEKVVLSHYGQWDGYFKSLGVDVLNFCKENLSNKSGLQKFSENFKGVKALENNEVEKMEAIITECQNKTRDLKGYGMTWCEMFKQFHRDTTGAEMLQIIYDLDIYSHRENKYPVRLDNSFNYIEFIYIIDIDNKKVYGLTCHENAQKIEVINKNVNKYINMGMTCFFEFELNKIPSTKKLLREFEETNKNVLN